MHGLVLMLLLTAAGGLFGLAGMFRSPVGWLVLGLLTGLLARELFSQRRRLTSLETEVWQLREKALQKTSVSKGDEVVFSPVATREGEPKAAPHVAPIQPAAVRSVRGEKEKQPPSPSSSAEVATGQTVRAIPYSVAHRQGSNSVEALMEKAGRLFTGGNPVLRLGIVILFFGVAFLVKYASQHDMLPLELRLAGAAAIGVVLLAAGWRLRSSSTAYGLALQGAGIGVLYLVVFGAARLYGLAPMAAAMAVLVALVALSCLLAVLQDAKSLAFFGSAGGFLAPVLLSSGGGSHVALFSYFALLNCGIVAIAWFKSWRELNLLGFFFTFGLATLWGARGYRPEHFATTEPFLVLFFLFYLIIAILFAHRQPVNLRGFLDGPLVFALPLVSFGLQWYLVRDCEYGLALSALGLGAIYLVVATLLFRRAGDELKLLCEAFLALGVVFTSLAIPFAFDGRTSAAVWALEGAGMVWIGGRQQRLLARHFGLLLQLIAGLLFLGDGSLETGSTAILFLNGNYLGCLLLSLAALFSSFVLDRHGQVLRSFEHRYAMISFVLGLIWWYVGGVHDIVAHIGSPGSVPALLLYGSGTTALCGLVAIRGSWRRLYLALLLQLPLTAGLFVLSILGLAGTGELFHGLGCAAWPLAFAAVYFSLYFCRGYWPERTMLWHHALSLWLLMAFIAWESSWAAGHLTAVGDAWSFSLWGLVPAIGIFAVLHLAGRNSWPVGEYSSTYLGAGSGGLAIWTICWILVSLASDGDPYPLPYLVFLNPLELSGALGMGILLQRAFYNKDRWTDWRMKMVALCRPVTGGLFFLWINSVLARSVHFYLGTLYDPAALFHSVVFQAAIAVLWGVGALGLTVWASRHRSRLIWLAGAALLGLTVLKLFAVDLSGTGTIARIVSFLAVGVLMLIIGYFSPMPPRKEEGM